MNIWAFFPFLLTEFYYELVHKHACGHFSSLFYYDIIQIRNCLERCKICPNIWVLMGGVWSHTTFWEPWFQIKICWGISVPSKSYQYIFWVCSFYDIVEVQKNDKVYLVVDLSDWFLIWLAFVIFIKLMIMIAYFERQMR